MRRIGTVLGAAGAAAVLLLAVAPAASADEVDDAVSALTAGSLYVAPDATGKVPDSSRASVVSALGSQVKVAVLPSGVDITNAGRKIQAALSGPVTLAIIWGKKREARSSYLCGGFAQTQLNAAFAANQAQLNQNNDLTQTLIEFAASVRNGPTTNCSGGGSGGSDGAAGSGSSSSSGSNAWAWIVGLLAAAAAAIGGLAFFSRRKKQRLLSDAQAKVMPYYDRLANEVNTLMPGDNATARQAVADAAERFTSAGSQLSTADSVVKYAQVRRTVLEGLTAARTARTALGLDPGPELPPIDQPQGEQLTAAQQVTVQGQTFQGYPSYTPGAPYYYGGGAGVPGGWYGTPFWETLLIGSLLTGGFGGFGGGGYNQGYGAGYDQGYDAGHDANSGQSGGGDWGSGWGGGGGGDWGGGGGGDWGGGGGGGDSGGSW